ncbi:hypothetical protein PHYSODRAFT_467285 [Phytophthora sojae]|uniref:Uncharacterized protein n=1 Tax=Phytophthora sojae (strain P6497) TaxID=1094619 RepID=G4YLZ7_PHYSP|nr:hypothetical protein PHYSODRAFT_467285 [Phytophthora sojae]EGZ27192.1 hypothetical protein PHYSODRAFT_467285 [Phytophthora sojae]|eukprot:XP_009514467.1 hypothetical protein PHYSODRAFT_467285 [Phytophthora sojae]
MKADETILRGVTTFADLSYHFVISCKAGKMSILLKDRMSKRQWSTGYLSMEEYTTPRNSIQDASTEDYAKVLRVTCALLVSSSFQAILKQRFIGYQLSSSICSIHSQVDASGERRLRARALGEFTVLQATWTVSYVFQLEHISVERIRALEARLRNAEDELKAARVRSTQETGNGMIYLECTSSENAGMNRKGQICWSMIDANGFELSEGNFEIRCLVNGWYVLSLAVFLTPTTTWGLIELQLNGQGIRRDRAVPIAGQPCSASCVRSSHLKKNDVLTVAVGSALNIAAALTIVQLRD